MIQLRSVTKRYKNNGKGMQKVEEKILSQGNHKHTKNYISKLVVLNKNGKSKTYRVHRLVRRSIYT